MVDPATPHAQNLGTAPILTVTRDAAIGPELNPQTAATLAKLVSTLQQIKQLEADVETYKGQLRTALVPGAYTVGGKPALAITTTRRFNADRASELLPSGTLASITRPMIDAKLAKEMLPPALYQMCSVEAGKPTVKPT